jgi:hypothetical protein
MKTGFFPTLKTLGLTSLFIVFASTFPVYAAKSAGEAAADKIKEWTGKLPFKGALQDSLECGPFTIEKMNLAGKGRTVEVTPGAKIHGTCYVHTEGDVSIDAHHVVGFVGSEKSFCVVHSAGWKRDGEVKFSFNAPKTPGVYQVRFGHAEAFTCERATTEVGNQNLGSEATMALVIVKK